MYIHFPLEESLYMPKCHPIVHKNVMFRYSTQKSLLTVFSLPTPESIIFILYSK